MVLRFLEASWRRCHRSSGFSLSQFVLFLHVSPDRLMMIRSDLCVEHWLLSDSLCKQKSHWIIITINGKMNVWKYKLIFPTDTLQQKIQITDLNPVSVLIILATTVYIYIIYKSFLVILVLQLTYSISFSCQSTFLFLFKLIKFRFFI